MSEDKEERLKARQYRHMLIGVLVVAPVIFVGTMTIGYIKNTGTKMVKTGLYSSAREINIEFDDEVDEWLGFAGIATFMSFMGWMFIRPE